MNSEPYNEPMPNAVLQVTIKARRNSRRVWEISCPEWKCTLHSRNLTRKIAELVAHIENHNDQCEGVPWT